MIFSYRETEKGISGRNITAYFQNYMRTFHEATTLLPYKFLTVNDVVNVLARVLRADRSRC